MKGVSNVINTDFLNKKKKKTSKSTRSERNYCFPAAVFEVGKRECLLRGEVQLGFAKSERCLATKTEEAF